jgi:hypothetical protein
MIDGQSPCVHNHLREAGMFTHSESRTRDVSAAKWLVSREAECSTHCNQLTLNNSGGRIVKSEFAKSNGPTHASSKWHNISLAKGRSSGPASCDCSCHDATWKNTCRPPERLPHPAIIPDIWSRRKRLRTSWVRRPCRMITTYHNPSIMMFINVRRTSPSGAQLAFGGSIIFRTGPSWQYVDRSYGRFRNAENVEFGNAPRDCKMRT